ncbi:MAG: hypothetical protein N4A68_13600 [Maledivibacter sp.]|jgi:acetylornithine/succinyldiaminopimelate/putrescine aminotransferase|nr:hypothetical protein [Maledivibacter sp.]
MALDKATDIIKRTKKYMDEIASFGVNNMGRMDKTFQGKLEKNIDDLSRVGFVQISDMVERLMETRDIKTYVHIGFVLREMQNNILKAVK